MAQRRDPWISPTDLDYSRFTPPRVSCFSAMYDTVQAPSSIDWIVHFSGGLFVNCPVEAVYEDRRERSSNVAREVKGWMFVRDLISCLESLL